MHAVSVARHDIHTIKSPIVHLQGRRRAAPDYITQELLVTLQ